VEAKVAAATSSASISTPPGTSPGNPPAKPWTTPTGVATVIEQAYANTPTPAPIPPGTTVTAAVVGAAGTPAVAGVPIVPVGAQQDRLSVLIWGAAGVGKTVLACTAPGRKLLVQFDIDGASSVAGRKDVFISDLSQTSDSLVDRVKGDNPLGLRDVLANYDTLIVDSVTNFSFKALMHGVAVTRGATVERPGLPSYGVRSALTTQLVRNVLVLTARMNKHVVFTAHEDAPEHTPEGAIAHITIALGGDLPTEMPKDLSEVWNLTDLGRERRIAIRPCRQRTPMKSRMFTTSEPEFMWRYNADMPDDDLANVGHRISDWFDKWRAGGKAKIALPK
jgi:phage nucleotide-binding protein